MKRGTVVLAAAGGDYGKPRPWVVIQSDAAPASYPSFTLCPVTTWSREEQDFRIRIEPSAQNGLRERSWIMADKAQTLPRERLRGHVGAIDAQTLRSLDTALRVWLGLA